MTNPRTQGSVPAGSNNFVSWQSPRLLGPGQNLAELISRGKIGEHPLRWVAFFDLDNLYPFNQALGHTAGDQLIVAFWQLLTKVDSAHNFVTRYGGDEFVWLSALPEDVLQKQIRGLREKFLGMAENCAGAVTLSCAYAEVVPGLSKEEGQRLFAKVSELAQETAKRLGKNKMLKLGSAEPEQLEWSTK